MITYKQSVIVLFIVVFQKDVVILHLFIARVTSVTITLMPTCCAMATFPGIRPRLSFNEHPKELALSHMKRRYNWESIFSIPLCLTFVFRP